MLGLNLVETARQFPAELRIVFMPVLGTTMVTIAWLCWQSDGSQRELFEPLRQSALVDAFLLDAGIIEETVEAAK